MKQPQVFTSFFLQKQFTQTYHSGLCMYHKGSRKKGYSLVVRPPRPSPPLLVV